jgi:hypothetical protein
VGDGRCSGGGEFGPTGRRLVFLVVLYLCSFLFFLLVLLLGGSLAPEALRTAHLQRAEGFGIMNFLCTRCFRHISLRDDAFVLLRELNKNNK